jgi:ferritin
VAFWLVLGDVHKLKVKGHQRIASSMSLTFLDNFLFTENKELTNRSQTLLTFVVENGITIWLYSKTQLAMI